MKTRIIINPKYAHLGSFINQIPENFASLGEQIYKGRNDVSLVNVDGLLLTIKYFKRLTLANRYIYATLRKTKAQRAYEHAEKMLKLGFNTPESVAYIDCYKNGMLYKNFYVCLYTDYKPINQLMDVPLLESAPVIRAFANYTYRLHQAGIFHSDFTISNILYKPINGDYKFSLIDNNRMNFGEFSHSKAMKNLNRLNITTEMMGVFAAEYAREANTSEYRILDGMVFFRWYFLFHRTLRKKLKMSMLKLIGKQNK